MRERIDYPIAVDIVRVERLERSPTSRKFEDVVCEID